MNRAQRPKIGGGESHPPFERGSVKVVFSLNDRGGRRSGFRQREFSYDAHIPERRSGAERRSGTDRRELVASQIPKKGRRGIGSRLGS